MTPPGALATGLFVPLWALAGGPEIWLRQRLSERLSQFPKSSRRPQKSFGPRGEGRGEGQALRAEGFEDADEIGDRGAAHVHDAGELGVGDLHLAGLTRDLH